jgi:hypothetical protein
MSASFRGGLPTARSIRQYRPTARERYGWRAPARGRRTQEVEAAHVAIDREGFRAWLIGQEPDAAVGHVWTSTDCALSHYLNESRGGRWSVGCCAVDIGHDRGRVREPLPTWAWTFLERIDRLRAIQCADDPLTAREALMVLDSVDESPLASELVIDLTHLPTEPEQRAMAKARHPSNAARDLGKASSA